MSQFEEMQTFVRIVEAGSITRAAEQMDTVKSSVSKRLSELEKRLGVTLLRRTTRRQSLTDTGRSYYQQCLRVIDDLAEIESGIRNAHCALAGRIKIAAPLSFGLSHLSQPLRNFNEHHPDIYFDVNFNDRKVDLIEEGFDLAIRIARLEDSTLIAKRLMTAKGVLCASPAYFADRGKPQTPAELSEGHVKLHYQGDRESWHFRSPEGKSSTVKIPPMMTANNGDFLCQAAVDGKGIIYSPDFICYQAIRTGQLEPILCDYMIDNEINAYALYPQTRHMSQRVRSLVDYLVEYFGEEPYWAINTE